MKACFCIGPEKCTDQECKIVKDYNEEKKQLHPFSDLFQKNAKKDLKDFKGCMKEKYRFVDIPKRKNGSKENK